MGNIHFLKMTKTVEVFEQIKGTKQELLKVYYQFRFGGKTFSKTGKIQFKQTDFAKSFKKLEFGARKKYLRTVSCLLLKSNKP